MERKLSVNMNDILWVDFGNTSGTSKQGGKRPAVVISNDLCNKYSTVIHVAPITSVVSKHLIPTHVNILLEEPSLIMVEQSILIDKDQILEKFGHLSNDMILKVKRAIKIQFGL